MFQLTKDTKTFDFDITGAVQSGGTAAGTWSTNQTNQIVLTATDATLTTFDVVWQFNPNNQLEILSGGASLINFNSGSATPTYSNDQDVLVVQPDSGNAAFTFQLHGDWGLDEHHNLTFKMGDNLSTLDGFLQDTTGQFSYHFFDLDNLLNENILTFPGKWHPPTVTKDGKPEVEFAYDKKDGTQGLFDLPGDLKLDPSINEFVYTFDKGDNSSRLQFVGTLHVSSDFTIKYSLDRETSPAGSSTTFDLDAVFNQPKFEGDLQLAVKKEDGSPGTGLTIGGKFTASLGADKLSVGFNYSQPASGNTQTIGFNGTFTTPNGNDVTWNFTSNSTSMTIDLTAHIEIGAVQTEEILNITTDHGEIKGIHALFGIKF
jgi:hypothetical protein